MAMVIDTVYPLVLAIPDTVLLSKDGKAWTRMHSKTTPWESPNGGGYGQSDGDEFEIAQRFLDKEGPFQVVFEPEVPKDA